MTFVIAHRGDSGNYPENTLISFRSALELQPDYIELDVYATKDRQIICLHDHTLDRTTNGTGKPGDYTLAEIKTLDAGSWKDPRFAGERIPTLEEALNLMKGRTIVQVEVKEPGIEREVVEVIRKTGSEESVVVISFLSEVIRKIRELAPELPTGQLLGSLPDGISGGIRRTLESLANVMSIAHPSVTPELVSAVHRHGITLWAWNMDEAEDIRRIADLRVDAVASNFPARAIEVLGDKRGDQR